MAEASTLKRLNQIIVAMCVVGSALLLFWGGGALIGAGKARSAQNSVKRDQSTIMAAKRTVSQANSGKKLDTVPKGLVAVTQFQSEVESVASGYGCAVSEFVASPDLQSFMTRFSTDASPAGWSQIEVKMAVTGTLGNVLKVLAKLNESEIPFEFNSSDLARTSVDSAGESIVTARVDLRVLARPKES